MGLTLTQLEKRDSGSDMAVIDRAVLDDLDVSSGDFVAIDWASGSRAVARVWPSDVGGGIVRIDG